MKEVIRGGATVLFVSHNLKTVAEFCHRCLLLEKGRTLVAGPAQEVISSYVNRSRTALEADANSSPVAISRVAVRSESGESSQFQSGQKAWIDVELIARERSTKLSVSLYIQDELFTEVFNTSTERLGHGNFTLEEGEIFLCTFELNLNMPTGIFHPSILIYRYDNQTAYDRWEPAATIYISSPDDVRGYVHCFPKVVRQEIRAASETSLAAATEDLPLPGTRNAS